MTATASNPHSGLGIDLGDHLDRYAQVPTGVRLCHRVSDPAAGSEEHPVPLVLVSGLSQDQTAWPEPMLDVLAQRGLRVITLDNRDSGRSTRFESQRLASKLDLLRATAPTGSYTLEDMGADVIGLLDHLDLERVHLAGMSMGGMIGQVVASTIPERIASFTSIFSTTGQGKVGQPAKATMVRFAARAPRDEMEGVTTHLTMTRYLAGRDYPPDVEVEVAMALRTWRRGAGPRNGAAVVRQISAIQASGDRTASLSRITAPTLVLNGDRDPMVAPSGGLATHRAIVGSRHQVITGMGHHIGPGLDVMLGAMVADHAWAAGR